MISSVAFGEKTNSIWLIRIVDIDPYLGLQMRPCGLPRLSTKMMSVSFSMAFKIASEEMEVPFAMVIDLT